MTSAFAHVLAPVILDQLQEAGILVTPRAEELLRRYLALVREWNTFVSLVSRQDVDRLESVHLPDSVSLAPWVRACWDGNGPVLDIGSGGGFPAVPLQILFPQIPFHLVERSDKKVGFLRQVVSALGLDRTVIFHGEYPGVIKGAQPGLVMTRAVENPERIARSVARHLPPNGVFLCLSSVNAAAFGPKFHVEHVDDWWKTHGYRRGTLLVVRPGH